MNVSKVRFFVNDNIAKSDFTSYNIIYPCTTMDFVGSFHPAMEIFTAYVLKKLSVAILVLFSLIKKIMLPPLSHIRKTLTK